MTEIVVPNHILAVLKNTVEGDPGRSHGKRSRLLFHSNVARKLGLMMIGSTGDLEPTPMGRWFYEYFMLGLLPTMEPVRSWPHQNSPTYRSAEDAVLRIAFHADPEGSA